MKKKKIKSLEEKSNNAKLKVYSTDKKTYSNSKKVIITKNNQCSNLMKNHSTKHHIEKKLLDKNKNSALLMCKKTVNIHYLVLEQN